MKLFMKISLLLLLPAFVEAQHNNKQLDSQRMALGNAANDTIRMDAYDQLAYYFYEIKAIANDIKQNSEKILFHGKRADAIVKGMLQHSRTSQGKKNQQILML